MNTEMVIGETKVRIGLDRLVIGIPYPEKPKPNAENQVSPEQVAKFQAQKTMFVANMKYIENTITNTCHYHCVKTKNKDLKRYKVLSKKDGPLLCIFSLGFSFGTGVINFEVNPSRLTEDQWPELLGLLSVLFYDHYEELYTKGVVSHAEFYVDVPGVAASSLVLIDDSRRTTTHYKGTAYNGKRGARNVSTKYDKAKEQKQDGQLVRIETRINRRDIPFQDLVEQDLFNPFSNLLVVEVNRVHMVAQEMKVPKLANRLIEYGLYGAIKNKPSRIEVMKRLAEEAMSWWKPETIWASHRELLQKLKPSNLALKII